MNVDLMLYLKRWTD